MLYFLDWLSVTIEKLSEFTGKAISWLVIIMALLINYDVAMRYFLQSGSVAIQEIQWHLFSLIFLLGSAYTLKHDDHVRLDIFYRSAVISDRQRAWINLFGSLFLLLPFCILINLTAWPFVMQSYVFLEGSPDPGGLPYRWLLKMSIPIGFSLLLLQGIADAIKSLNIILGRHS